MPQLSQPVPVGEHLFESSPKYQRLKNFVDAQFCVINFSCLVLYSCLKQLLGVKGHQQKKKPLLLIFVKFAFLLMYKHDI